MSSSPACAFSGGCRPRRAPLEHLANGKVRVRSAGSEPADALNPAVVAAMAEVAIDLSREFPKPLTDAEVRALDVVITMGCGDACPIYPGQRFEDWRLQDPAGQPVEVVRGIRDQIDGRVQQLLAELVSTPHWFGIAASIELSVGISVALPTPGANGSKSVGT